MRVYLPSNLIEDFPDLIYNNRPNFKPYKLDKLHYIIHLINSIPLNDKDLIDEEYTPINAKLLQQKIQNYKDYLNYLTDELKVIESDDQYIPGFKSKGFKLIKKYQTSLQAVQVQDFAFRKTLLIHKNRITSSVSHLNYLTKWFDDGKFEIDLDFVKEFLKEELNLKRENEILQEFDRKNKKPKDPINQYNHALISAERISYRDFHLLLDDTVYRLHTNLTNMHSIVRNALTYDGKKLISLDIKNSQPYLSTLLLSKNFWVQKNEAKNNNFLSVSFDDAQTPLNINIDKGLYFQKLKISKQDSYIMLGEISSLLSTKDFQQYIDLVIKGQLYEFLQTEFEKELGLSFATRKEAKTAVFQILFTDNRFLGQEDAKPKKVFKKLFPNVYTVFAEIKRKDKTLLPRLLQSIESYLMIDVIAKRVAIELPKAPIYTIHDSISTTEEYVKRVKEIMNEELKKAIGHAPVIQEENWKKENITKYLDKLKEKAKTEAA